MYIYTFLLRMTNTMTSQNIDLSSWDTMYISYTVGDRAEPCGTPAFISLGRDISLSTKTEFSLRKK
jgi:hypothetical protein